MKPRLSPRSALVIIATLFAVPLLVAWLMTAGIIDFHPGSTRNFGTLVQPARPIDWGHGVALPAPEDIPPVGTGSDPGLSGHWVILNIVPQPCGNDCLETVRALRQIYRAAGRYQPRIRVALLLAGAADPGGVRALFGIWPGFNVLTDADGQLLGASDDIARTYSGADSAAGASFLVDPLGNIMLYYEAGYDPNHLNKDLKRLLAWSKLDKQ